MLMCRAQKPIILQGHERSLTQIVFNAEGDLLFSASKDVGVNVWFTSNGERLGTFNGHNGTVWTVAVDCECFRCSNGIEYGDTCHNLVWRQQPFSLIPGSQRNLDTW